MTIPVDKSPAIKSRRHPLDELCINTIRTLAMDAVQAANSGHPGTPMAMAPVGYYLWQYVLRFDPQDPIWPNRDRFVLSAGHASMLLYSLLAPDRRQGGQQGLRAAGRAVGPARGDQGVPAVAQPLPGPPGVPLDLGRRDDDRPARPGAGQQRRHGAGGPLDGRTLQPARLRGPDRLQRLRPLRRRRHDGGHLLRGRLARRPLEALEPLLDLRQQPHHDRGEHRAGLHARTSPPASWATAGTSPGSATPTTWTCSTAPSATSSRRRDRPTLIIVDSHIGWGAPHKQDTSAAHGEPLGEEEIRLTKRNYGWPEDAKFLVPDGVYEHFREGIGRRGKELRDAWFGRVERYRAEHPELADELYRMQHRQLPDGWDKDLPAFPADPKGMATRISSGKVLNAVARNVPWLIGGAADLAPSTKTRLTFEGAGDFEAGNYAGRNLHFGIREHAMGAILNGMALVKVRPFGSGFLIFSDYGRMPIRLAAIMEIPVIYVFTHDSIGVGEDGPTHQPIEQLASLRAIPGLIVLRPADANEVVEAWKVIMQLHHEPAVLVLTRQDLPTLDRTKYAPAAGLAKGAYVLADAPGGKPDVLLMATGSEVSLCVEAHERLKAEGIRARVVSMPSWELFDDQDAAYRDSVLPPDVTARVSVEQASIFGWAKYVGLTGQSIGMRSFGASAPLKDLQREFGFTVERVVEAAKAQVGQAKK